MDLSDEEIVQRVRSGERPLFELLMRRHNQRIYRAVRSILRDEAECEDAMQQAYADAYAHLGAFEGRSSFATWLTRIAVHEALARVRKAKPIAVSQEEMMDEMPSEGPSPEQRAHDAEMQKVLVQAIDALPDYFRSVFVLRAVQGLSVQETAEALELNEETVKTRLHRARGLLQQVILERTEPAIGRVLDFPATRCDRVVFAVMKRIGA